jgi:hypothetical protein
MVRPASICALAGGLFVVLIYIFDAGHGFVKDDFGWILTSRVEALGDVRRLMDASTGFFRPIVSLSFALNYAWFGMRPIGYGLTNLALALACMFTLMALMRALGVGRGVAVGAALLWALNFQGINMAVLWISGRTALLVTLFSTAAAWAWTRERRLTAALLAMTAMWSKEEAFALPAILTAWSVLDSRGRPLAALGRTWPLWAVAAASLAARAASGAFTPASAPSYYRYQFGISTFIENAVAYSDRVGTTAVGALFVFWLAAGAPGVHPAGKGGADGRTDARNLVAKGAIWITLSLAPTILLPVRSSLYAVLPSAGAMLIISHFGERIVQRAAPASVRRAAVVVSALFVALLPAYRVRNTRYVNEAELSTAIVAELSRIASTRQEGGLVLIRDVRDARPTAEQALGPLADRAAFLASNGKLSAWIEPPPSELSGAPGPDPATAVATLVVEGGRLRVGP